MMASICHSKCKSASSRHATMLLILRLLSVAAISSFLGHNDIGDNNNHAKPAEEIIRCIESEMKALLAIQSDMYDPGNWLSSWNNDDCCKWRGVTCDNTTSGHVTRLDLRYPYSTDYYDDIGASKVNPSLLELKHLKYLDLSMNYFAGAHIPKMIALLVHLEYLNLSYTSFSGLIPPQLGNLSSLRRLGLGSDSYDLLRANDLDWLSRIPSLEYLDMRRVNLSQATSWLHQINSIPTLQVLLLRSTQLPPVPSPLPPFNLIALSMLDLSFSNNSTDSLLRWFSNGSRSLEYLYLSDCNYSGNIDMETLQVVVGALGKLKELDLSYNDISGEISGILRNVNRSLEYLDLSSNGLTGDISQMLGDLTRLRHLNLAWNQISEIPRNVNGSLEYLDLSNNQLTGDITQVLGDLTRLRHLDLASNQISKIPRNVSRSLEYLDLRNNRLTGDIPQMLGDLTRLRSLDLGSNQIVGEIPPTMGNLVHLEYLDLSSNNITGQLPQTMGNLQNLGYLVLDNNFIIGEIPETMGRLFNLRLLDLSNNHLRGQMPRTLGGLCKLIILDLSDNNVDGELTYLFDGLLSNCPQGSKLSYLNLEANHLSGMIPASMGHLSQLEEVYLSSNSLLGDITESHFSNLTNLVYLNISHNSLNVILPNDWYPPFNASSIDMSFCRIVGKFPDWIRTQMNLEQLYLSGVGLSGNLPPWFSEYIEANSLEELVLSSNHLNGSLPYSLCDFMDLSNNSFSGLIPLSFVNSTSATVLSLSYNNINGSIPSFFCNLTALQVLDLSSNKLSGKIPNCHSSFPSSLQSLHLNSNNLCGTLPSFLAHCIKLETLNLGENKLYGEIPTWMGRNLSSLKILCLRSNLFHGVIPINIANLTFLHVLDISSNNLFGSIPSSIGNFSSMIVIENSAQPHSYGRCSVINRCIYGRAFDDYFYKESTLITAKGSTKDYTYTILSLVASIDLSNNSLSGEIPEELTNLLGLRFLNLSNNYLIGRIPEKIGAMGQLESLDLSVNHLSGEIPLSLSALNFLNYLNLSHNNLSGRIPTSTQLSTLDPSIYAGNANLCGRPLKECPSNAAPHGGDEESGDKLEILLKCTFTVLGFVVGFWVSVGTIIMKQSTRIALFCWVDNIYDWIYMQFAVKFLKLKSKLQGMK
ncbi:LRR receptor-like serine/threonine-protein kinase FLS2 [Canna indica]|uniref:LRR receptor-like serine/threonine-protein kinase FLS2 n=1 Tax=Canna indica TaxID=4628 RepID=A0AAQ3PYF4_9LILI|nr:LRR receptor-like serine/threonine-protein kinase FLS2 [Canna indica]